MLHATPIWFWLQQQKAEIPHCKKPSVGGSLIVKPRVPRLLSPASTESSDPITHLTMVAEDERRSGDLPTPVNRHQAGEAQKLCGVQREATPPTACQEIPMWHQQRMWLDGSLHCSHGENHWHYLASTEQDSTRTEKTGTVHSYCREGDRLNKTRQTGNSWAPSQQGRATHSTRRQPIAFCDWGLSYSNVTLILSP